MESVRSASLNEDLGRSLQHGPGAKPLLGGQGAKPPEAESFLSIFIGGKFSFKSLTFGHFLYENGRTYVNIFMGHSVYA